MNHCFKELPEYHLIYLCLPVLYFLCNHHSLIGLHVHRSTADDIEEQNRPLSGLLGAPLHRVKHATNLINKRIINFKSVELDQIILHDKLQL